MLFMFLSEINTQKTLQTAFHAVRTCTLVKFSLQMNLAKFVFCTLELACKIVPPPLRTWGKHEDYFSGLTRCCPLASRKNKLLRCCCPLGHRSLKRCSQRADLLSGAEEMEINCKKEWKKSCNNKSWTLCTVSLGIHWNQRCVMFLSFRLNVQIL